MNWMAGAAAVILMGLSQEAMASSDIRDACKDVHRNSWYQIGCSYSKSDEQWTLHFRKGAYRITMASGRHDELVRSLCTVAGDTILEIVSNDVTLLIACGPENRRLKKYFPKRGALASR